MGSAEQTPEAWPGTRRSTDYDTSVSGVGIYPKSHLGHHWLRCYTTISGFVHPSFICKLGALGSDVTPLLGIDLTTTRLVSQPLDHQCSPYTHACKHAHTHLLDSFPETVEIVLDESLSFKDVFSKQAHQS